MLRSLLLLVLVALSAPVGAVPSSREATVAAVQVPAWLERHGVRRPLLPGQPLHNHDRVFTGVGGRVLIQLPEGSVLRLGEQAGVGVHAQGVRAGRIYVAAFDIAQGAFRLSAEAPQGRWQGRVINVRAGRLTVGVREADVWGRAGAGREMFCLLAGAAVVNEPQVAPLALSDPYGLVAVAPDGQRLPSGQGEPLQVRQWAAETEIQTGAGVLQPGGRWSLVWGPVFGQGEALEQYDRLRSAGYPARIRVRRDGQAEGGFRYEVRSSGFASRNEAQAAAARLAAEMDGEREVVVETGH